MHNKKLFLRVNTIVLSTFCLLLAGCNKQEPAPSKEEPKSENPPSSSVVPPEETYNIVRPSYTPDYDTYKATFEPFGFNMTYYSDIYSRGFAWFTSAINENGEVDDSAQATELYLVKSDKGENADFAGASLIEGTTKEVEYNKDGNISFVNDEGETIKKKGSSNNDTLKLYAHKVHVENLEKGKAYSYKIGSEAGYTYGAFIVEKEQAKSITAVHMSDAQTKNNSKLNVWRNTFTKAVDTAGEGLDVVLYNGDQFDQNNSTGSAGNPSRVLRFTKAVDIIRDYKFDIPYMPSAGNHEEVVPYINYFTSDITYGGFDDKGCYYSYDYDYAHFVVLNTNSVNDTQINWLKDDLEAASDAKWKVVMMHISPYSTGDHSNKSENKNIVEKLTPVFSENHVDLVLQAHDHTYNKTLPYRWDAAGYTTSWNNDEVVNLEPETEVKDGITYDKNPEGTYYVTTGAAGHRCGSEEEDGRWAEVVYENGEAKGLDSSNTFLNNTYKIELGKLTQTNSYEPYSHTVSGKTYASAQEYNAGDLATGNVNAQMFGVLNLTATTMSYHVYTVNGKTVKLFDTLDVLKA